MSSFFKPLFMEMKCCALGFRCLASRLHMCTYATQHFPQRSPPEKTKTNSSAPFASMSLLHDLEQKRMIFSGSIQTSSPNNTSILKNSSVLPWLPYSNIMVCMYSSHSDDPLEVELYASEPRLKTEKIVPGKGPPPEPPTVCCMSGCADCVWIKYAEALATYYQDGGEQGRKAIQNIEEPYLRAFVLLELESILENKAKQKK